MVLYHYVEESSPYVTVKQKSKQVKKYRATSTKSSVCNSMKQTYNPTYLQTVTVSITSQTRNWSLHYAKAWSKRTTRL